ncbi:MAG: radical SAM protein [Acidobacteriota bacterium]|jgi:sulfatase maturation enzyme AslB (radical SAM superfamily)
MPPSLVRNAQIAGRLFHKGGLPVNLIVFVTSHCNLLCRHCFYWEELNRSKNELRLDEFEMIARSIPNLLSVSLTGGEPYLRPDIGAIAEAFERHAHVRNLQIPSNGFLVERTIERASDLLRRVRNARVSTGVSLDGPRDIHNLLRQNPKSFDRAIETLQGLKELKPNHPNLSVGVALTVSAANQGRLEEFFDYLETELQPDAVTVTLARGNPMDSSLKQVDLDIYRRFAQRAVDYRRRNSLTDGWMDRMVIAKEEETYRLVSEAARAETRVSPCYAGELIGILSETGEVYLCETLDRSMGNVRDFRCDLAALWRSETASAARQYQKELGCQCTYECAMSVNTLFNPRRAQRIIRRASRA